MNFETFMHEVSCLKAYRRSLKEIQERIDDIIYQYAGVRGIRYDKELSVRNIAMTEERMLAMAEALKEPEAEYDFTVLAIARIERNVKRLPKEVQDMVKMRYIDGHSLINSAAAFNYSPSGLYLHIRAAVEKL